MPLLFRLRPVYSSSVDYLTSFRGAAPSCPLQGIPTPGCLRFISSMALLFLEMILGDFFLSFPVALPAARVCAPLHGQDLPRQCPDSVENVEHREGRRRDVRAGVDILDVAGRSLVWWGHQDRPLVGRALALRQCLCGAASSAPGPLYEWCPPLGGPSDVFISMSRAATHL